jgi:hypothetical protein
VRDQALERLKQDLIGPGRQDECISDRPADRYLTGILFPQELPAGAEEDDSLGMAGDSGEDDANSDSDAQAAISTAMRPASMGLSFAVASGDSPERISVFISCGRYKPLEEPDDDCEAVSVKDGGTEADEAGATKNSGFWRREGVSLQLPDVPLGPGFSERDLSADGLPGIALCIQCMPGDGRSLVTAALVNRQRVADGDGRREINEKTLFQVEVRIRPGSSTRLVPRPPHADAGDEDGRAAALIYRDAMEFAVGHTCSAEWDAEGAIARELWTSWVPSCLVQGTSSDGDDVFDAVRNRSAGSPLSTAWLADAQCGELKDGLNTLVRAYRSWISGERKRIGILDEHLRAQAQLHLDRCDEGAQRMQEGAALIESDPMVCAAFRLANLAILTQRRWSDPECSDFHWRPFQLGFLLLSLASVARRDHPDRLTMDLLWFPTGGGKTEAYLGLTAFTLFYRRLSGAAPDTGAGVSVIMRYTLRLLTIQQFQRAAALVLACEHLRKTGYAGLAPQVGAGTRPFSIGVWLGGGSTPNNYTEAKKAGSDATPKQLSRCPACQGRLNWRFDDANERVQPVCPDAQCCIGGPLPVWTVDTDVYRELPSLVIGTVDKFTQIVRKPESGQLFGLGTPYSPPDLIIQDELHLISGPLGTLTGLYEIAVDELCSRGDARPKVIGSTATIRRAAEQIRQLFNRDTYQFPSPGIDAGNSCFAVTDTSAPGRLYVGVTSAGRSPKFSLQAACASLLQSAVAPNVTDPEKDPYWTLIGYFNSLRELGGALVLMHDDVSDSIDEYARRRSETARQLEAIEELTSRVPSSEIPDLLDQLGKDVVSGDAIDIVLATNMISVGVDVPRLGLMVVNGQPKGIAEYIQATSRVGRGRVPGLVLTVFNNIKTRDRAYFETFSSWHRSLYRDVEAGSVTPFAPRARDRAIHAVLVGLARHLVGSLSGRPALAGAGATALDPIVELMVERAKSCDPDEEAETAQALNRLIDIWLKRGNLTSYWNDRQPGTSLLVSAEQAAANAAAGRGPLAAWATPNSMRNVEPSARFVLVSRLAAGGATDAQE